MSNRLEEIKNEYAKSHNYVCWDQFISDQPNYKKDQAYNDVYIVYAVECCKATLEKAKDTLEELYLEGNLISNYDIHSINNEQNITLI